MTNWSNQSLKIENDDALWQEIEALVAGSKDEVDLFGHFLPMPKVLREFTSGNSTAPDGTATTLWRVGPDNEIIPISPQERAELVALYGTADWYDWACNNWGTKWDADDVRIDSDTRTVRFCTAWGPPVPFLVYLSARHPKARLTLAWSEAGMGNYGTLVFRDGELKSETTGTCEFDETEEDGYEPTGEYAEFLEKHAIGAGG